LIDTLYRSLDGKDHNAMAACYHDDATFKDIAFDLKGKKRIHAMWHMIAETDLRATFSILKPDDQTVASDLTDVYTFRKTGRRVVNQIRSTFHFRDGLIIEHIDSCDAWKWGVQALGPVKGTLTWLIPCLRRSEARKVLEEFLAAHPEYR
jgi:hypothetical protein